jgi:hypothetical protein
MMELRLKQLEKTKAYRDAVLGLRDNVIGPRKRVIIAPSMEKADDAKGGKFASLPTVTTQRASGREKQIADSGHSNGRSTQGSSTYSIILFCLMSDNFTHHVTCHRQNAEC